MHDQPLTEADQKEALSRAYVAAVVARAGYTTTITSPDRDGIDLRIQASGRFRPALDVQLKATARLGDAQDGVYRYPLNRSNYDSLRMDAQTPRLLVILDLPKDKRKWLFVSREQLVMTRAAYWTNLAGCSETTNISTVTVSVPVANLFNVDALRNLMAPRRFKWVN